VNVVFFSPEDLNIIKNGPAERRKFIDLELCQLDKLYVHSLTSYNRVLIQRNKLLKELQFRPEYEDTLDIWDLQLVQYGKEVIGFRRKFITQLNELIHDIHWKLSGEKEDLRIVYDPDCSEETLQDKIAGSRIPDEKQKTTLHGPHRDDIGFFIGDIDIRKYGSQGQQRTAALSLKLSEIELVKKMVRDYPILLLDDVLSELDGDRQHALLSAITHIQTLITCTGLEDFVNNRFPIDQLFRVVDGTVTKENQIEEKL
jgi:DNA replication and repair protein RecF